LKDTHKGKDICGGSFENHLSLSFPSAVKKADLLVNLKDLDLY
jgi:hypothetical protein